MNHAALVLYLINLLCIGGLPFFFFRRDGRFNARWWMTGAPFFLCGAFLVAAAFGLFIPIGYQSEWGPLLATASVPLAAGSIAMIFATVGIHRIPLSLWHQENDAPKQIVTYGPYRRVRHPFYVSFLMTLIGAVIYAPHPITVGLLLYGYAILNYTAAKEEARLQESEFGNEYKSYMESTGRFLPWSGRTTR